MKNEIEVHHFFQASHKLTDSKLLITKQCATLHGHSYYAIVKAGRNNLNKAGMVTDFACIKNTINYFDHKHINDLMKEEPTAENIAKLIFEMIEKTIPDIVMLEVRLAEGYKGPNGTSWAIYKK